MIEIIQKTREYLDYIEEHYNNVQKAWKMLQEPCKNQSFIYDDFIWHCIDQMVKDHDLSKLSDQEFVSYREKFFGVKGARITGNFIKAWDHHKEHNDHHWENWTSFDDGNPYTQPAQCVCMVIDWMAMGLKFGDTARDYYNKNKKTIKLPEWAVSFINEIFDAVYGPAKV